MTEPTFLLCDLEISDAEDPTPTILEVGLRTCTTDLETITEASWIIPYDPAAITMLREVAPPVVQEMHDTSGLWADCAIAWESLNPWGAPSDPRKVGRYIEDMIRRDVCMWIAENAPGRQPLCGSSVHNDLRWLTGWCPDIAPLLHTHRVIDVSSLRELLRRWRPEALAGEPVPAKRHRVLPDLDDTVALLAYLGGVLGVGPAALVA